MAPNMRYHCFKRPVCGIKLILEKTNLAEIAEMGSENKRKKKSAILIFKQKYKKKSKVSKNWDTSLTIDKILGIEFIPKIS